jgi:hypothetical protein
METKGKNTRFFGYKQQEPANMTWLETEKHTHQNSDNKEVLS